MRVARLFVKGFVFLFLHYAYAADDVIYPSYSTASTSFDNYYAGLLKLVLEKTKDKYGDYTLSSRSLPTNQGRVLDLVDKGQVINVFWTMTSLERENALAPIRVPLMFGLSSCRLLLINKGSQSRFNRLSLSELSSLDAGQGYDWPDTKILQHNGFNVVTGTRYEGLFDMLKHGRFDYFPRAAYEAWTEHLSHSNELVVEQSLYIYYDAPIFFFVSKSNPSLFQRLNEGLIAVYKDGSFYRYFVEHALTGQVVEKSKLDDRVGYKLENPFLSQATKAALQQLQFSSICSSNKS